MRATYSPSTCGMHHMSRRHGLRSSSARRRRTVSRDTAAWSVSRTLSPASRSSVQRLRPAGGLEQAAATSSAVAFPDSLRAAPGRGSSLRAASRLPSTKRRLVRYTVEPPTETTRAISSSPTPASAASRICARLILRAACLPPPSIAVSWARSAHRVPPCSVCSSPVPPLSRTTMNRAAESAPEFTQKQGQYLAFISAYTLVNRRPPAQADFQRFFRVTPPTVHQMLLTLKKAQLISRKPGVARSIVVLVERDQLPRLHPVEDQTVKSYVTRY